MGDSGDLCGRGLPVPTGRSRRIRPGGRHPARTDLSRGPTLTRELLAGPTLEAASALLGSLLVQDGPVAPGTAVERRVGRIVEIEAYIGEDDLASHARFGRTARNAVMYGPPGVAYVYLVYGLHECLNVVTEPEGRPAALLVRAVEPVGGIAAMRAARAAVAARQSRRDDAAAVVAARLARLPQTRLAAGPGLVAAAFGITRRDTGLDLLDRASPLRLEPGSPPATIAASARIGIGYAAEPWRSVPWRLFDPGSPALTRGPRSGPADGSAS